MKEAAHALHADWNGLNALFTGISIDSRTIQPGDLFICLSGENFDGHQFVSSAAKKGAVAAMVNHSADRNYVPPGFPLLLVTDTRSGLGALGAFWRQQFSTLLAAVTGSNGKTTVKEMIASILRQEVKTKNLCANKANDCVLATEGNLNNDIGVPLMLSRLRKQHIYAVIEMGMNHIGEISYLAQLAKPNIAVITNAGAAHIEGLGSVEAIAHAKGEIFSGLNQNGVAIINADDHYAPLWRRLAGDRQVVEFGLIEHAQVTATYQGDSFFSKVNLNLPDGTEQLALHLPGEHNVRNALAAAATATGMGIKKQVIASGLENFTGVKGRMQKKHGRHHATLIDDSYNANPESVRAALAVLATTAGKKIMVLGDMGELGESAANLHKCIGREARSAGLDKLLTIGKLSAYAAKEFGKNAQHFKNMDELLNETEKLLAANVTLLIKGSRFMQMERIVQRLEN